LNVNNETVETPVSSEADGKCPDARLPKSRGITAKERYLREAYNKRRKAQGRFMSMGCYEHYALSLVPCALSPSHKYAAVTRDEGNAALRLCSGP
jgi:hypothetical protein